VSILGNIFGRIFHHDRAQGGATTTAQAGPSGSGTAAQPTTRGQTQPAGAGPSASATTERVDVAAVLDQMASKNPQKLNWRTSIVDLMKLVGMDSTLQERKELADELGYKGDKSDTATMNMWLHKQVMKKLEENGGKVPADLKD
jgi:hypothetical protein